MLTKNELKRFRKKEQSCTGGHSPYYDEYITILKDYKEAKNETDLASKNCKRSRAQLDAIDPEKTKVNPDDLVNGPWKEYVIFRFEKLESINETRKKMKTATKKVYYLMNKVSDPSFKGNSTETMQRIKKNLQQFSGWKKSIDTATGEIDRKRAEATLKDAEYRRLNTVLLEDNAVFSEKFGKSNQLEKELEQYEYRYRAAVSQTSSK